MQFKVHLGRGAGNSRAWLTGWPGRVLAGLLGVILLAGLLLFFTVFAVVGLVMLVVFGVRLWWRMRKVPREMREWNGQVIDAEHTVVDVEVIEPPREER